MAFRELRDFTEYMRVLGYPRLVSVDNFRTPNFPLVADILYWMVHRYEPSVSISDDISTEDCRVEFLSTIAQVMAAKATVKLNTKRLYAADGKAVKELLKVAKLLYAAHEANVGKDGDQSGEGEGKGGDDEAPEIADVSYNQLHARLPDVKATRRLASQITESGAKLFDLLHDERDLSAERLRCLRFLDGISNNLDSGAEHKFVEQKLEQLLDGAKENVAAMEKQCQDLASDEKTLQVKIKKRQSELERNDKRLKSLQSVRPAFMDEYEKLEAELEKMYEVYMEKFRNLDYLEHRLEQFNQRDREKIEQAERARKRIQVSIMEKKARDLRGDEDDHLYPDDDEDDNDDEGAGRAGTAGTAGDSSSARPGSRNSRKSDGRRGPSASSGLGGASNNRRSRAGDNLDDDDDESEMSGVSGVSDDDGSGSSLTGSLSDEDDNHGGADDDDVNNLIDHDEDDDGSDSSSVSDSDISDEDGINHGDEDASDLDDSDDNF